MEIVDLYQKYLETGKVSTDTREITSGSVFFALRGPTFNANEFAEDALKKGARYAVIDDPKYALNDHYVVVKDSLEALQDLARHHRSQLSIPFIGLTGSNGKTTSKELVNAVLSKKFKVYATRGNLNNHIGVPLTVLSINNSHEVAVIEMGANHVAEIAVLCEIAQPTHGFITNIGRAHIGTFGGFDNIVRAKSELYQYLLVHNGVIFINSLSPVLNSMAKRFKQSLTYPQPGDYYHCQFKGSNPFVNVRTESGREISTQLVGNYNFENVAAALCIGKYFNVSEDLAAEAIAGYVPGNMRSQVIKKGTNTIILDAYNANPSSMEAAIDNLSKMQGHRKVAILGDMYELEQEAEKEHALIGSVLTEKGIAEAWLCGPLMKSAVSTYPSARHFETKDQLIQALQNKPIEDSLILIKASRGMSLEKVLEYI